METPRRSPRIAERYGVSVRPHISLEKEEEHPYKEMIQTRRLTYLDGPPEDRRTLCVMTVIVLGIWAGFFGALAFQELKGGREIFSWETSFYP